MYVISCRFNQGPERIIHPVKTNYINKIKFGTRIKKRPGPNLKSFITQMTLYYIFRDGTKIKSDTVQDPRQYHFLWLGQYRNP